MGQYFKKITGPAASPSRSRFGQSKAGNAGAAKIEKLTKNNRPRPAFMPITVTKSVILKLSKVWIAISITVIAYFVVRFLYFRPTHHIGEPAPLFSAILADGSSFDLERLQGKYVLLDFWGSWCGPCIKDKPVLKRLYQKYNIASFKDASGFEIVSIAIEESDTRWRAALSRSAPVWPLQILDKVSSLRFFDGPLTRRYRVKRLPSTFLLDPEGKILETNPTLDMVESILSSQLTQ